MSTLNLAVGFFIVTMTLGVYLAVIILHVSKILCTTILLNLETDIFNLYRLRFFYSYRCQHQRSKLCFEPCLTHCNSTVASSLVTMLFRYWDCLFIKYFQQLSVTITWPIILSSVRPPEAKVPFRVNDSSNVCYLSSLSETSRMELPLLNSMDHLNIVISFEQLLFNTSIFFSKHYFMLKPLLLSR